MYHVKAKPLARDTFAKYGTYASFLKPDSPYFSAENVVYYRDHYIYPAKGPLTFSTLVCSLKEIVVDSFEYHNHTGEGCMVLDNDAVICLGIATPTDEIPLDEVEAFIVPKGTIVYLNPGVWHWEPYPLDGTSVTAVIILPERTYKNDCYIKKLSENHYVSVTI